MIARFAASGFVIWLIVCACLFGAFQSFAQLTLTGAGKTTVGGGGRTCTDGTNAAAFNARTSGQNNAHLDANCVFINWLDTKSLFALADGAWLLATDTAGNAALNLISTSFTLTVNGSPAFTADSGYVGGSTANLDTGFNPTSASSPHYTLTSASLFGWTSVTPSGDAGSMWGYASADTSAYVYPHFSDNKFYWSANGLGTSVSSTGTRFFGFSRTGAGGPADAGYQDTTSSTGGAQTALANSTLVMLNRILNTGPFTQTLQFGWLGQGLNSTQEADLCHGVYVYMNTIAGATGATC